MNRDRSVRGLALILIVVCLPALGCNKDKGGGSADTSAAANDLRQLGMLYHAYNNDHRVGPSKTEDLVPLAGGPKEKKAVEGLKTGSYVLIWSVKLTDYMKSPGGLGDKVLGYAKDVPTVGGPVLMGDGEVKNMTADEFKKAPTLKGKS